MGKNRRKLGAMKRVRKNRHAEQPVSGLANNPDDSERVWIKGLGYFSVIIGDVMVCVGLGLGLGYLATAKLGAPTWITAVTGMAGLTLAFYRMYLMTKDN